MSATSETEEGAPARAGLWPWFSAWVDGVLAAQRESLVLWMPVLFGCGIGAYFSLRTEPDFVTWAVIAVTAASFFTFMTGLRRRDERFYPLWLVSAAALLV